MAHRYIESGRSEEGAVGRRGKEWRKKGKGKGEGLQNSSTQDFYLMQEAVNVSENFLLST